METPDLLPFPLSKLAPPVARRPPIARPRLFAQLGSGSRLLLVTAPAGFGKSSLLASSIAETDRSPDLWRPAHAADHRFVWYSLDEADADPGRLVDGLAAAYERVAPGTGGPSREMLAAGANVYAALASLVARAEQAPTTLVLDNCHNLEGAGEAERALSYLLANCPSAHRIVIAGRGTPATPVVAALAAGAVRSLGPDDLQFGDDEAAALAALYGVSEDRAAAVVQPAAGWAIGIVLLAHAGGRDAAILQRPIDALADYLMSEIVDRLPEASRRFVLESALLGTFDAAAADAILERTDSALVIDGLLRRGIFLDCFPSQDGFLTRYHDLFAAAMAGRLQRQEPRRCREIHRRASDYYADDPHRALAHGARMHDPDYLAQQLDRYLPMLRRAGHWEALVRYGEQLPVRLQSLFLQRVLSFAHYTRGDDRAALAAADRVYEAAVAQGDREARYSALVLRANTHFRQERYAELLQYCLPALSEARAAGFALGECWLAWNVSKALLREGRVREGLAMVSRTLELYRSLPGPSTPLSMAFYEQDVVPILLETGDCERAERLLADAGAIAGDFDDRSLVLACEATRAEILLLRGEFTAAADLAEREVSLTAREGSPIAHYTALRAHALACSALRRHDDARRTLDRYVDFVVTWPGTVRLQAEVTRIRLALAAGDSGAARRDLAALGALDPPERLAAEISLEAGTLALLEGRDRDADRHLGCAATVLARYARRPAAALALVLRAQAMVHLGKQARAATMLGQAGELACDAQWLPWLVHHSAMAIETLRTVESYWRLQGKARKLYESLLESVPKAATQTAVRRQSPPAAVGTQDGSLEPIVFSPFGSGTMTLHEATVPLSRIGGGKAQEMLAYAIWQARPLHREEILEAVWDGRVDEQSLSALRKAGYQIRRLLGEQAWQRAKSIYTFMPPVDDAYRSLLATAVGIRDLKGTPAEVAVLAARALANYSAPYLSWCYSDWVEEPRSLAETAALALIEALAQARRELGQPLMALEALERGLAMQPYNESLRRAHVQQLLELGKPVDAAASYQRHLRVLKDEDLGAPSSEFLTLRSALPTA